MSGKTYLEIGGRQTKKIYLKTANGEVEIKKAYSYPGNQNVYSSGHIVVYHIDTNNVISQEVDDGADCISNAPSATKSGWAFHGWREDTTASSNVLPSKTCNADNIHLYAVFVQTITVTLYNNSATAALQTGYKCYNNGNTANPSFAPVVATVSGWNIRGWSTNSGSSATITYNSGASFTTGSNITLYASWSRTVTVSYNGNNATSGSTANSTGTAYRNYKGDVTNTSITLRANGYSRTNYIFSQWAMGSASGTRYNVGATVSLSASTTFYAYWVASSNVNKTFNYTGGVQSYTVAVAGVYKLEAYGARGGNVDIDGWGVHLSGGGGGISSGNVRLNLGAVIYICAGGAGNYSGNEQVSGGYNGGGTGGGSAWGLYAASGGGATHIATTNRGVLSNYNSYRSEVLLVAGGGGGALYQDQYTPPGEEERSTSRNGGPGNGTSNLSGNFGYGGTNESGGGGGYYGGNAGHTGADSAGGSGYVGGCISGTTSMQTGGNSGHGYAKITFVSA